MMKNIETLITLLIPNSYLEVDRCAARQVSMDSGGLRQVQGGTGNLIGFLPGSSPD